MFVVVVVTFLNRITFEQAVCSIDLTSGMFFVVVNTSFRSLESLFSCPLLSTKTIKKNNNIFQTVVLNLLNLLNL